MTCDEFDALVIDLARAREEDLPAAREAELHASTCTACRTALEDQRLLSRRLQTLGQETSQAATPVALTDALRAAFRQNQGQVTERDERRGSRGTGWLWPAAAVLLLGVALLFWRTAGDPAGPETVVDLPTQFVPPPPPAGGAPASVASAEGPQPVPLRVAARVPRPQARRAGAARVDETGAVFLPLVPGDRLDDLAPGRLVRVGLPRAALVSWGWPVEGDVAAETVEADVLVGEDGVARAVRVAY